MRVSFHHIAYMLRVRCLQHGANSTVPNPNPTGLALKIFVWTLPLLLGLIMSFKGYVSTVERDLSMLTTFYLFQVGT